MPANDGSIGTHGSASTDKRTAVFGFTADSSTRIDNIRKYHAWAKEYIIFAHNARIDTDIVLYLAVSAKNHIR